MRTGGLNIDVGPGDERPGTDAGAEASGGGVERSLLRAFLYLTLALSIFVTGTRAAYGPQDRPPGDTTWLIAAVAAAGLACSARRGN